MKLNLRKQIKKYILLTIIGSISLIIPSGCGSPKQSESLTSQDMAYEEEIYKNSDVTNSVIYEKDYDTGENDKSAAIEINRKLIKRVSLDVDTNMFDELMNNLETKITSLGGYIESSNTWNGSCYYQSTAARISNLTVRIPKDKLDSFVEEIGNQSNIISKEERVEDVTLQYVDMESHKSALLVEQERLLELMSQAESIDDIITIESRLSDVRYQLESMESQLRTYDNLIDYATISISISEVVRFTPQPTQTTWEKIKEGFSNNLFNIKKGIKNFCIGFIIAIPYLILWAIIIVLMFFLIRFLIKWNDKRNTRKKEIKERRSHQTDEKVKNE